MNTVDRHIAVVFHVIACLDIFFAVSFYFLLLIGKCTQSGVFGYDYVVNQKVLFLQILAVFFMMLYGIEALIAIYFPTQSICSVTMRFGAATYGIVTVLLYLFLLKRSKMVQFGRGSKMKILENALLVMMTLYCVTTPIILILQSSGSSVIITDHPENAFCAFRVNTVIGFYLVTCDLILSTGYLILFIVPLLSGNQKYRSTAIENLILSTIMILSTSCTMFIFSFFATDDNSSMIAANIAGVDIMINIFCACLMTRKGWKIKNTDELK